jgi:hypothetical protein
MDKRIMATTTTTNNGSFWDRLQKSDAWRPLVTRSTRKANGNSLRIKTPEDWCWLLLYREASRPGANRLGVLARFVTPTGQATWAAVKAAADTGRIALPEGARFGHLANRGLPRWNVVVTRDLPLDGVLKEEAQFAWLVEQATALAASIEPMIGHSHAAGA